MEVPTDWPPAQVSDDLCPCLTGPFSSLWRTEEFFFGWTLLLQAAVVKDWPNRAVAWSSVLVSLFYWLILFTGPLNMEEAPLFFFDTFTLAHESKYHPPTDGPWSPDIVWWGGMVFYIHLYLYLYIIYLSIHPSSIYLSIYQLSEVFTWMSSKYDKTMPKIRISILTSSVHPPTSGNDTAAQESDTRHVVMFSPRHFSCSLHQRTLIDLVSFYEHLGLWSILVDSLLSLVWWLFWLLLPSILYLSKIGNRD